MTLFQKYLSLLLLLPVLIYIGFSNKIEDSKTLFEWEWRTANQLPKENEKRILLPMEKWLMNFPSMDIIKSQPSANQVKITARFSIPYSQKLYNELKNSTLLLSAQFPTDVSEPIFRAIQKERSPDLILLTPTDKKLPAIQGLSKIESSGENRKEYGLYLNRLAFNSMQELNHIAQWVQGWNCQERIFPIKIGEKSFPSFFSSTPFPSAAEQQFQAGITVKKENTPKKGMVFHRQNPAKINLLYFKGTGSPSYYWNLFKCIKQMKKIEAKIIHNQGLMLLQKKAKESLILFEIILLILFFLPRYRLSLFHSFFLYGIFLFLFPDCSYKPLLTLLFFALSGFLYSPPMPHHSTFALLFFTLPLYFIFGKDIPTALRSFSLLFALFLFYRYAPSLFTPPSFQIKRLLGEIAILAILLFLILFLCSDFQHFHQITILFPPQVKEERIQQELDTLFSQIPKASFSQIDKNQLKIYFEKGELVKTKKILEQINQMPNLYAYEDHPQKKKDSNLIFIHPKRESIEQFPQTLYELIKNGSFDSITTSQIVIENYHIRSPQRDLSLIKNYPYEHILAPYLNPLIDKIIEKDQECPVKIFPSAPNPVETKKLGYRIEEQHHDSTLYRYQFQPSVQLHFLPSKNQKSITATQKELIALLKKKEPLFAVKSPDADLKQKKGKLLTIFIIPLFLHLIKSIIEKLLRKKWIMKKSLER